MLSGEKTPGQVAKAYGAHPNSVGLWKRNFVERAPEIFAEDTAVNEYGRWICQDVTFELHPAEFALDLPNFLALDRRQTVPLKALVTVRLLHPAPHRRRRGLELPSQLVRAASLTDQYEPSAPRAQS